jgi:hypothetical protein
MMRGEALVLAAQMLCSLLVPVASPAQTQVERTRDVGFATVRYENGLTLAATTLYESVVAKRKRSTTSANGLVSLFHDGRWSLQGYLEGSTISEPVPSSPAFSGLFKDMRGEIVLDAASSAQSGFMPTLQLTGASRVHFDGESREMVLGASVARTFDGRFWQTTVLGEASAFFRSRTAVFSFHTTPMQLAVGDFLQDNEGEVAWTRGSTTLDFSLGIRVGEAQRGTVGWGGLTVTWPVQRVMWTSVSLGSYPADLLQSLPGGRYAAVTFRLPNGKLPPLHRPTAPPVPVAPKPDPLPVTERLAMVVGFALDSADLREIRVWAPGIDKVELMADFVDWLPVPLIKQPNGEWRGYYRVSPGLHRFNLLLNGTDRDVPTNQPSEPDDFGTKVGIIQVRG